MHPTNNKQQTTNNKQQTTNNKQQTTTNNNKQQQTTTNITPPQTNKPAQVNEGKLKEAVALLDGVLEEAPDELSARVTRGTARALLRDLKGAVADFDAAVRVEPR